VASERFQRLSERLERREATAEAWMELRSNPECDEQTRDSEEDEIEIELTRMKQAAGEVAG
jgi:hypothetical protein